jgi:hypothetical protein
MSCTPSGATVSLIELTEEPFLCGSSSACVKKEAAGKVVVADVTVNLHANPGPAGGLYGFGEAEQTPGTGTGTTGTYVEVSKKKLRYAKLGEPIKEVAMTRAAAIGRSLAVYTGVDSGAQLTMIILNGADPLAEPCAEIVGAVCPGNNAANSSRVVQVAFGEGRPITVSLYANPSGGFTGFDAPTGMYVGVLEGRLKYAKPGDRALTEVAMLRKVAPAGDATVEYTGPDGPDGVTVKVVEGVDPFVPLGTLGTLGGVAMWVWIVVGVAGGVLLIIIAIVVAAWPRKPPR